MKISFKTITIAKEFALKKNTVLRKKIVLFSFGHVHKNHYPQEPAKHICQLVLDLRLLRDPYREADLKESGLDEKVKKWILKENKKFFNLLKPTIREWADLFLKSERFNTAKIHFGCYGGWQRSVVAAEFFKDWLKKEFSGLSVTVKHLNLSGN